MNATALCQDAPTNTTYGHRIEDQNAALGRDIELANAIIASAQRQVAILKDYNAAQKQRIAELEGHR